MHRKTPVPESWNSEAIATVMTTGLNLTYFKIGKLAMRLLKSMFKLVFSEMTQTEA